MMSMEGGRQIIFTRKKQSLEKILPHYYFALCRISVNCSGIEMGCESIEKPLVNCLSYGRIHN
jgi:hypothetical protein